MSQLVYQNGRGYRGTRQPDPGGAPRLAAADSQAWSIGRGDWNDQAKMSPEDQLRMQFQMFRQGMCQCASQKQHRTWIGCNGLADGSTKPGEKMPDELIGQAIKETTMHEVGHTLGLRHNFKGSTMLKNEQLHDTVDHAQARPGRFGDGLRPGQPRSQGSQAGRLLQHDARAL